MPKEAVFTMKLEPHLRAEFMAEAAGEDRPASQVVRQLMRDYIAERRQAREYRDYLQGKVDSARSSMHASLGTSNDEVEAAFAARRRKVTDHS